MDVLSHPIAYLGFDGNCRQAMEFYAQALDGEIEVMMTMGDSPMAEHCAPDSLERIMHARLKLPGGGCLMAGDCPGQLAYEGMKGFNLTLNFDTVEEASGRFEALSQGGVVQMPLQPTFWAKIWAMFTDQFGTPWIVNGEVQV